MCSLLADGESLVDVINAEHFEVVRAVSLLEAEGQGHSDQGTDKDEELHTCRLIIITTNRNLFKQSGSITV